MPLRLNVGASQKIADGRYGSRGASVNLDVELDASLVLEPAKLQERIRQLFGFVRQSVKEELKGHRDKANSKAGAEGSSVPRSKNSSSSPRLATSRQIKALHAIAKQQGFDLHEFVRERVNLDRPDELTLLQASELITALKAHAPSSAA